MRSLATKKLKRRRMRNIGIINMAMAVVTMIMYIRMNNFVFDDEYNPRV